MDAVYLITPILKTIQALIKDFEEVGRNMYRSAHVYLTEGISFIFVFVQFLKILNYCFHFTSTYSTSMKMNCGSVR